MANYFHGVSTRQNDTSISTPVTADSGIAFVVGAAPGHTVGGAPNDPIMCQSYAEAVAALGYSDDWEKYPICERDGSKRLPISEFMGPSTAQMAGNSIVLADVEEKAQEVINKRVEHEITRILNGYGG